MTSRAFYRLPHQQQYTFIAQTEGKPAECFSFSALNSRSGYVVAPFSVSSEQPILVIRPDIVEQRVVPFVEAGAKSIGEAEQNSQSCVPDSQSRVPNSQSHVPDFQSRTPNSQSCVPDSQSRTDYHIDFLNFHAHLLNGDFRKLVLSRAVSIPRTVGVDPEMLFFSACSRYPRMFISLVDAPQCGTWLTATPEILLSGGGSEWLTIALAGTMPYSDALQCCDLLQWSEKNRMEQRIVATYITEQLEQFTPFFTEKGPFTARAGHLAHLRSDFHFTLSHHGELGNLIQALHPTPAVCGLPKQSAIDFILKNEHTSRSYYSGFMGPLDVEGQTHLYVSLRCMQIFSDSYRLYAGGGLLKDSNEEQEWMETEAKLDTMRALL